MNFYRSVRDDFPSLQQELCEMEMTYTNNRKVYEALLLYPHTVFRITPEGNRRKTLENEIPVKVLLDVDTVNIINEFDIEDDI